MTKKVERVARISAPAEYHIPASFAREVGRIVVRWSYLENCVRRLCWDLLGVDAKIGRIAIRDPRLDEHFNMITDLAFLKKIKLDADKISSLKIRVNEVSRFRDLAAHGIWIPHKGKWILQWVAGNYPKNFEAEHRKRRVNPEGVNVNLDGLRTVSSGIQILIDEVLTMRQDLQEQLPASPQKDREP